jgi:hypothetical protein
MQIIYYIFNGNIIFFGMINKIVGFEEFWNRRKTVWINLVIMFLGLMIIGWVLKGVESCEEEEFKYDQKKLRMMELKEKSAQEIKSIMGSLQEGILVVQN